MSDIKPIPDSFLSRLLQEFGIEWTHLVIISGAVASSFGLQEYVNPGIWILGTVGAFALVYLFRLTITGNFPKVAIWCGLALTLTVAAPTGVLLWRDQDVPTFLKAWTKVSTLYLSVVSSIPLGIAILAYRKQDEFLRTPLPSALDAAVKEGVLQADLISDRTVYQIYFTPLASGDVSMRFNAEMRFRNRLKTPAPYRDIFDPAGRDKKFHYAAINDAPVDQNDPERLSGRGLILSHLVPGGGTLKIEVIGESTFYGRDSELVGVYFPAASLSILIHRPPDGLAVNLQSLLPKKQDAQKQPTGDLLFEYDEGVLPFQGVRLFWELHVP